MPRRLSGSPPPGVLAPALLFTGMAIAVFLFGQSYSRRDGRRAPAAAGSSAVSPSDSAAAAAAHAAMGVPPGGGDAGVVFREKVQALKHRLAAEPDNRHLVLQFAQLLRDGHQGRKAVPYYRKAIAMDSADPQPYYDLATIYASVGDWDQAADLLRRRIGMDAGDAVALYDLGAVRANQRRTKEARALFEQARSATSSGPLIQRISRALARLGPS